MVSPNNHLTGLYLPTNFIDKYPDYNPNAYWKSKLLANQILNSIVAPQSALCYSSPEYRDLSPVLLGSDIAHYKAEDFIYDTEDRVTSPRTRDINIVIPYFNKNDAWMIDMMVKLQHIFKEAVLPVNCQFKQHDVARCMPFELNVLATDEKEHEVRDILANVLLPHGACTTDHARVIRAKHILKRMRQVTLGLEYVNGSGDLDVPPLGWIFRHYIAIFKTNLTCGFMGNQSSYELLHSRNRLAQNVQNRVVVEVPTNEHVTGMSKLTDLESRLAFYARHKALGLEPASKYS